MQYSRLHDMLPDTVVEKGWDSLSFFRKVAPVFIFGGINYYNCTTAALKSVILWTIFVAMCF